MSKAIRENILNEVERILQGPIGMENEQLENNPLDFYTVGVLYPVIMSTSETGDDLPENTTVDEPEKTAQNYPTQDNEVVLETRILRPNNQESSLSDEESLELTTKFRPSAAGISVLIKKGSKLSISISFGTYKLVDIERAILNNLQQTQIRKLSVYTRQPFSEEFEYQNVVINVKEYERSLRGVRERILLSNHCSLDIVTRPYKMLNNSLSDLEIKTFTLINEHSAILFKEQRKAENCIFQPKIFIQNMGGFEHFEDLSDYNNMGADDLNLRLLYRNYKSYALGHGISVDWKGENRHITQVESKILPVEIIKGVDLNPKVYDDSEVLYMKKISGTALNEDYDWKLIKEELNSFVSKYKEWIENQGWDLDKSKAPLPDPLLRIAKQNLIKCQELFDRMHEGIQILEKDPLARKAFEDANQAMFMQRVMADFSKHRRKESRILCNSDKYDDQLPRYEHIPYNAGSGELWENGQLCLEKASEKGTLAKWRPFQLAFLLFQVRGITDPNSEDRDTVDLIWFPTGGGKTEAYLGLTGFSIFYRRLKAKLEFGNADAGAGVSVLMRYTLRLLNKQQFERAGILICACDLIRRQEPNSYGVKRISNGIWMGGSMTPNKEEHQIKDYKAYMDRSDKSQSSNFVGNTPPILSCPCCGNRLIKEKGVGRWGYFREKDFKNKPKGPYQIGCTNTKCDFHINSTNFQSSQNHTLPIYEVDEVIYKERPSLLFSTVDKFVQMAWNNLCFSLFNLDFINGKMERIYPSPSLIIQDELHLISSALGTIYGVYEIVIEKMCKEQGGEIAKIVGASATVRNAEEQCRRLYARKYFMQFPPPGIDADDSFFSKKIINVDPKDRMYVGFMTSGATTSTALIRLTSVLLERIPTLPVSNLELDSYYTLIVYFNALRELGKFRTFVADDIVAYRKLLANHFGSFFKQFNHSALCELSSVMNSEEITKGLDRLEKVSLPVPKLGHENLVSKLFNVGIRTFESLLYAKGNMWNDILNEDFFKSIGLEYTSSDHDFKNLIDLVKSVLSQEIEPIQIAPATNMISVGVDVPRLNVMIVNGQPKTASEYIQASSRVGRDGPGIVFSFLSPTKNRDRSHYERFKSFHQAYYYHVESSSVTPFSGPALEKVLPTVLVALTRSIYLNGIQTQLDATDDAYSQFIDGVMNDVIIRATSIDPESDITDVVHLINGVKEDFFRKLKEIGPGRKLATNGYFIKYDNGYPRTCFDRHSSVYNAPSQFVDSILKDHIPTLQTLRNVESSSQVSIKQIL